MRMTKKEFIYFLSGLKSLCDGYVMEQGFGIANMLKL